MANAEQWQIPNLPTKDVYFRTQLTLGLVYIHVLSSDDSFPLIIPKL